MSSDKSQGGKKNLITLPTLRPVDSNVTNDMSGVNVLDYLRKQNAYLDDQTLQDQLCGIVSSGVTVKHAAKMMGLKTTTAWRLLMRAEHGQVSVLEGQKASIAKTRERVTGMVDGALSAIESVMNDTCEEGETRLKAADKIIAYSGVLSTPATDKRGNIRLDFGDEEGGFEGRLKTITIGNQSKD